MKKSYYLIILFINSVLIWIYFLYPTTKISLQLNDIYYKFNSNQPNPNIVFVQIGEKSINKFGRWPWDREVLAKQISKIKNAKVILLDMVFSEPTNKDAYLADVIADKNIICGFFLRNKATEILDSQRFEVLADSSIELDNVKLIYAKYAEANVEPILSSCALNGVFSTISDKDNLYRRYIIAYIYKGLIFPSLGIQALRYYYNKDINIKKHTLLINNSKIPLDEENTLKLNFYKKYNIVSITDVDKYDFTNKIVIIGISEIGISDIRSTPIGQIPGPLLHYTFISNVLNKDYIKEYKVLNILFIFLAILFTLLSQKFQKIAKRGIIYISFILIFILTSLFLYKFYNIEIDIFYPLIFFIINLFIIEYQLFKLQEQKEAFIKEAFQSYLSPSLLHQLLKNPDKLKLGGEEKEITILFTDIRGFTTISEKLSPEEIINLINTLFSKLSHIIIDNKGMIDKYIGDAIMALFNAPLDIKNHAHLACKSAIEIQLAINKFNKVRAQQNLPPINMGIGINTDKVYVGNMGSDIKFNYSALGDGVNIASRLESETKILKVKILISKSTYDKIDKKLFKCVYKGQVYVKGKTKSIDIYSLEGYKNYMI